MNKLKKLYKVQKELQRLAEIEADIMSQIDTSKPQEEGKYYLDKYPITEELIDTRKFFNLLKEKQATADTFKGKDPLRIIFDCAVISKRRAYTYVSDAEMKKIAKQHVNYSYKVRKR